MYMGNYDYIIEMILALLIGVAREAKPEWLAPNLEKSRSILILRLLL